MTNKMMMEKVIEATRKSMKYKITWLMSNGKELKVVISDLYKAHLENEGFWTAMIFENGHTVEA